MSNPKELQLAADALRVTVDSLNKSVKEANNVRVELDNLIKQSKSNRILIIVVGTGAILNLIVIIALVFMGIQLNSVVETQRVSALCPLYQIFLNADTPENRARAEAQGLDMIERENAFNTIRESYDQLHCGTGD